MLCYLRLFGMEGCTGEYQDAGEGMGGKRELRCTMMAYERIIELPLKVMPCFVVEGIVAKGRGRVSRGKLTARLFLRPAYHARYP